MKKNRILTFVSNFGRNAAGLESQIYEEFLQISNCNELFVITEYVSPDDISNEIHVIRTNKMAMPKVRAIYKIIQYVIHTVKVCNRIDFVYLRTFSLPEVVSSVIANKFFSKRVVLLVPGSWIFVGSCLKTRLLKLAYKIVLKDASSVILYSKRMVPELEAIFDVNLQSKVVEIRNAVKTGEYLDSTRNQNTILCVGRIHPLKNFEDVISALPTIKENIPKVELKIIGLIDSQTYLDKLRRLVEELKCEENVHFMGPIPHDKIMSYYRQAGVFVIMGKNEGIPRSLLEAMSCGCPVVAAPNSGIPDVIRDGENGFLVENDHPEKLSQVILDVLQDPKLREMLASRGHQTVRQDFSWEKFVSQLQSVFDQRDR